MAGFDAAIEKLNNLNRELQEKTARDRKVAELQAMAMALLVLPSDSLRQDTKGRAQARVSSLVTDLTSS